jgi:hypothetical protein
MLRQAAAPFVMEVSIGCKNAGCLKLTTDTKVLVRSDADSPPGTTWALRPHCRFTFKFKEEAPFSGTAGAHFKEFVDEPILP